MNKSKWATWRGRLLARFGYMPIDEWNELHARHTTFKERLCEALETPYETPEMFGGSYAAGEDDIVRWAREARRGRVFWQEFCESRHGKSELHEITSAYGRMYEFSVVGDEFSVVGDGETTSEGV